MRSIHGRSRTYGESPIERKMLWSLMDVLGFRAHLEPRCHIADIEDIREKLKFNSQVVIVAPQALFGVYRVDVALAGLDDNDKPIVRIVECDGKDFHTSPSQVEYDRRRDTFMTQWGADVFRVTGSQINRNPEICAVAALLPFFNKHWSNAPARLVLQSKYGAEEDAGEWLERPEPDPEPIWDLEDGRVVQITERKRGYWERY